ncbi:MAG: response regulator [Bacteroidetes bacterium]|nr:response regulator [Bacteroidota bacterium]
MEQSLIKNRILLVDDDAITNMINEKLLRISVECKITAFTNPEEALEHIKSCAHVNLQELPDIILLDINMPQMDGWEFLNEFERLHEHVLSKTKVWMLTSSIAPEDIEKSKTYQSVKDFISKPLTLDKIKEIIA